MSDGLHKYRLLNVEEKPFKRITKRLLAPTSLIASTPQLPLTPPPDDPGDDSAAQAAEDAKQKALESRRQFREDLLLDFAAFESSLVRLQFLLNSNERERERYATEKLRIQATAQEVRDNTLELRAQLESAQEALALRKTWDDLSEKITNNRLLRPREDQQQNLEKLNVEIVELEKESKDYAETWAERRQQFGRIIEEGMHLRRLIRDEKEEVERREGMEEREDAEDGDARVSIVGTPMNHDAEGSGDSGNVTVGGFLHPGGKATSRAPSPAAESPVESSAEELEDANMAEDGEISGSEGERAEADGDEADRNTGGAETGENTGGDTMDVS